MRKIIYSSRQTAAFSSGDLVALLAESRRRNAADELSGLLVHANQSFLQLLEGPDAAVEATFARIAADPRHTELRVLSDEPAPGRRFPDWAMGFETTDDDGLARTIPGYRASAFPLADPATISNAAVAESLLAVYRGGL